MVDVDAHVVHVEVDLDVVGKHGQHLHAGKGRLAATLDVGGRDAHETMHAGLGREHAEDVLAVHGERRAVKADGLAGRRVVDLDLPVPAVAITQVHLEEHLAPVLGLEAALTRLDGDDCVAVVELAREPAGELEGVEHFLQAGHALGGILAGLLVVSLAGELVCALRLLEQLDRGVVVLDVFAKARNLAHRLLGGLRVVPEIGRGA